jgi:predicted HTH domain antitoxin
MPLYLCKFCVSKGKFRMETTIEIKFKLNRSILLSLKEKEDDFIEELLFNNAVAFYRKNKLSLGKAAELAGYSRMDFIWKLKETGEPVFDYEDNLITEMCENAKQALKITKSGNIL